MSTEAADPRVWKIHANYVIDSEGERVSVLLPVDEWEKLMDDLEDLYDVREYDRAKRESAGGKARPAEEVFAEIDAELERESRGVSRSR